MKIVIADDEAPARSRLRRLLGELPGVELAGEAANGLEAVRLAEQQGAELVLLDIRMPVMDGLEAARHLAQLPEPPAVVFTTAYGDYALQAFETEAVDYLLKPIRAERLARALERAGRRAPSPMPDVAQRARSHISAHQHGALVLVPVEEVLYFQADQKYVTVRHRQGEVLIEESLKALEEEFGQRFLRIHRNALVARQAVAGMEPDGAGHYRLLLRGSDERLEISRRHLGELKQLLKEGHL